jgi:NAD(P)H-dependent flavin oxidoreductase YrpB (nitropropane dioxygenase family)
LHRWAGGPSTPALAAAATNSGGLGFIAAGYLTQESGLWWEFEISAHHAAPP